MSNKKEKDPIGFWYMVKKIYPLCFRSNRMYYIFNQLMNVFHGVLLGAHFFIMQIFFDTVYNSANMEDTQAKIRSAVFALALFLAFYVVREIINAMHGFSREVQRIRIAGYINSEINKKSIMIDPIEYEDPKRLNDINKAKNGVNAAISFHDTVNLIFTFNLPYFLFMAFYLNKLHPMLILALLFVFIPVIASHILRSSIFAKREDASAPIRRESDAYSEAAAGKAFMKETRLLGSFYYLRDLFVETVNNLNTIIWKTEKRNALIGFISNTLTVLGYGGILFLLVIYLLNGTISVGAFAAVFKSVGSLFSIMTSMIRHNIGNIASNFGLIRNFLHFLEISSDNRPSVELSKDSAIILENMSFKYPNAQTYSLKNINLEINPGDTIAIIGENGAGKTTLVKLLTGLYKPTCGNVKIDGYNTNDINYKSLLNNVSGVFQRYQRYALTLSENIEISDFEQQSNQLKVKRMLDENNIEHDNKDIFPNGLETMLSRDFDGIELSSGQWQRIAIARGFYRNADVLVLDEPTAAIDPLEESAIYKKFLEEAKNKTAVIVTHRMGSARIAERIIVMREGAIVEIGSHDALLKRGGEYARMYAAQAEWYKK